MNKAIGAMEVLGRAQLALRDTAAVTAAQVTKSANRALFARAGGRLLSGNLMGAGIGAGVGAAYGGATGYDQTGGLTAGRILGGAAMGAGAGWLGQGLYRGRGAWRSLGRSLSKTASNTPNLFRKAYNTPDAIATGRQWGNWGAKKMNMFDRGAQKLAVPGAANQTNLF